MRTQPEPIAPPPLPFAIATLGVAAFTVGLFPIGDAIRAAWDTLTLVVATWIGA